MSLFFKICLHVLHSIYALYILIHSFWKRHQWTPPLPLQTARRRLPKHIAIILIADPSLSNDVTTSLIVQSIIKAVGWCRAVGVQKLTVFEERGLLDSCEQDIRSQLPHDKVECESSDFEVNYPLTPPPSDYSDSRPLSPSHNPSGVIPVATILVSESMSSTHKTSGRRRQPTNSKVAQNPLTLCLVSRAASKGAIAAAACSLARRHSLKLRKGTRKATAFQLSVDDFDAMLEGEEGLSSPDFMIVHSLNPGYQDKSPLELHGFPPWHIRLTEIHYTPKQRPPSLKRSISPFSTWPPEVLPLDEIIFREALDEFAGAEMRFGK